MAKHAVETTESLSELQSSYRTINAMLNGAKRRGNKTEIRELTRSKKRISEKLDRVKSQTPKNVWQ